MRRRRFGALLGGIGGLAALAAACAPAAEPAKTTQPAGGPAAAPQAEPTKPQSKPETKPEVKEAAKPSVPPGEVGAKYGGVLRMPNTQAPPGYIAWEEADGRVFAIVYPQMNNIIQYQTWGTSQQDTWTIVGDLAKSWEQSADGLTYTFRLQEGVKWSDGRPFTCADAKWSLDTIRTGAELRRSPRATHFRAVSKVECADDLTLVVTLQRSQASFLALLAGGTNVIYPKHAYEAKANLDKARGDPKIIGTGPFVVTEFAAGEKWVYQKRADYWKKPYPYLDGIEVLLMADSAVATALRGGRLDKSSGSSGFSGARAEGLVRECKECQFGDRFTSIGFQPLQPNHQRPPWNSPEVREALSYGIDKKKVAEVCGEGWRLYDVDFLHPDTPFSLPKERLRKLPGYNFDDPQGNKAKAREALAKAGYRPGELSVTIPGNLPQPVFPCLMEDLEAIGIKATTLPLELGRLYDVRTSGDFDVMMGGYLTVSADPDATFYEYFYTGSDRNYGRYSNLQVDRLIDLQSETLDFERRRELVWQIEEILIRETAHLTLTMSTSLPVTGPRVRNYVSGSTCGAQGTCHRHERVWLEQGK